MTRWFALAVVAWIGLLAGYCEAQVSSLTGTWHLNVDKSRWGKRQRPQSVAVRVEHNEPALKYSGTVVDAGGENTTDFEFSGAIDGKEYRMTGAYGEGRIRIDRVDTRATVSAFRSDDGRYVVTARTQLAADGKTMTRRIQVKGPDGETQWTEVYEKR